MVVIVQHAINVAAYNLLTANTGHAVAAHAGYFPSEATGHHGRANGGTLNGVDAKGSCPKKRHNEMTRSKMKQQIWMMASVPPPLRFRAHQIQAQNQKRSTVLVKEITPVSVDLPFVWSFTGIRPTFTALVPPKTLPASLHTHNVPILMA